MSESLGPDLHDTGTWPDLRFTFRLFPWHWRLRPRFYVDDRGFRWESLIVVHWLFLEIELWT